MRRRNSFASLLMACLLAVGFLSVAPLSNPAAGKDIRKPGESARNYVRQKRRARLRPPPIAPSYLAYDYPYYYSRGYYPTHIGPGYIYYGYPYLYRRVYRPRYGSRCPNKKCVANWRRLRASGAPRRKTARGN